MCFFLLLFVRQVLEENVCRKLAHYLSAHNGIVAEQFSEVYQDNILHYISLNDELAQFCIFRALFTNIIHSVDFYQEVGSYLQKEKAEFTVNNQLFRKSIHFYDIDEMLHRSRKSIATKFIYHTFVSSSIMIINSRSSEHQDIPF